MKVQDLFRRDIHRSINGVVKADQIDASSVWQELDEFVITKELKGHLSTMIERLALMMDQSEITDYNGVWVSGFFGSGKSHFIKVLSYLLENHLHRYLDQERQAVEFFRNKLEDPLLFAELQRITQLATTTILFNIDSKADHAEGRDALLRVFLKVLNERQGYSGDYPHIAHLERHLESKGQLQAFHEAYKRASGESWLNERDAWEFHRDEVIEALQGALGQSKESAERWVDHGGEHFSITVENFAKWVRHYLERQEGRHRVMFLVDEVGQFIGNDTHLMLNLQTITEQLSTVCKGRAWVVVTSQEDLDSVLGDLKGAKQHDFSKIQGRFVTRLSLSSGNVDEVIKQRLLEKTPEAAELISRELYESKQDVIKNQQIFVNPKRTFKSFVDSEDFCTCYPFTAYQFELVQMVFESIRKAGATGLHLSQGERSILDAFQSAAQTLSEETPGGLIPFYRFYPSVELFLDTSVKRTIDQASTNTSLQDFDSDILKLLFLIRYVDEFHASLDNITTLCIEQVDENKSSLREKIESSLTRLEDETLISRNGEMFFFLTNEERDIGRQIKNISLPSGTEERELGRMIFEEVLGGERKHTYSLTKKNFAFNRRCDGHYIGSKTDGDLEVLISTPLGGGEYEDFAGDERCILYSSAHSDQVLIRVPDDVALTTELHTYLQTDQFIKSPKTGATHESTKRILRERSEENRGRRKRIISTLKELLESASYFAYGAKVDTGRADAKGSLGHALEYLIQNAYSKMGYIKHLRPSDQDAKQEIQSTLRGNDLDQQSLITLPESNPRALNEVREYVRLCKQTLKPINLSELIRDRYEKRPYGWPEFETVLVVARIAALKEIEFVVGQSVIELNQVYEHLISPRKQSQVAIRVKERPNKELIKASQTLGRDIFVEMGPSTESELFNFLKGHLTQWEVNLKSYQPLAKTGSYPGNEDITAILSVVQSLTGLKTSIRFFESFTQQAEDLKDSAEDYQDLKGFYENQRRTWERLREAVTTLNQNRLELEIHAEAGPKLRRMEEILNTARPYGMIREVGDLIDFTLQLNGELLSQERTPVLTQIDEYLLQVKEYLTAQSIESAKHAQARSHLERLKTSAVQATSIAHLHQAKAQADTAADQAYELIDRWRLEPPPQPGPGPDPVVPPPPPKTRKVIKVSQLCTSSFIETQDQVDELLNKLRDELNSAIDANERVQIK